jgi:hypothetical protein
MAECKCPFCVSNISSEAMVCKYCRNIVNMPKTTSDLSIPSQQNMKQDIVSICIFSLLIFTNILAYLHWMESGEPPFQLSDLFHASISQIHFICLATLVVGISIAYLILKPNLLVLLITGTTGFIGGALVRIFTMPVRDYYQLKYLIPISLISTFLLIIPSVVALVIRRTPFSVEMLSLNPIRNWIMNDDNIINVLEKGIMKLAGTVAALIAIIHGK